MFYREDEREAFWKGDQVGFAEKAHEFMCCDIPTIAMCIICDASAYKACPNRIELLQLVANLKNPKTIKGEHKEK